MEEKIRQGDVLLKRVDGIEGKLVGTGKRILVYGEKTGHTHTLDGDVSYYESRDGQILCRVNGNAELVHQDHKGIPLHEFVPAGDYLVVRQREFDIVDGIVRQVSD